MLPQLVPSLFRIVLAIVGVLCFHMRLETVFSGSVENYVGILIRITLSLLISFGEMTILTMLALPIHDRACEFIPSSNI